MSATQRLSDNVSSSDEEEASYYESIDRIKKSAVSDQIENAVPVVEPKGDRRTGEIGATTHKEKATDLDVILTAVHKQGDIVDVLRDEMFYHQSKMAEQLERLKESVEANRDKTSKILMRLPYSTINEKENMETLIDKQSNMIRERNQDIRRLRDENEEYRSKIEIFERENNNRKNEEVSRVSTEKGEKSALRNDDSNLFETQQRMNNKHDTELKIIIAIIGILLGIFFTSVCTNDAAVKANLIHHEDVFLIYDLYPRLTSDDNEIIGNAIRLHRRNYQTVVKDKHPDVFEKMLQRDRKIKEKIAKLNGDAYEFAVTLLGIAETIRASDLSESQNKQQYEIKTRNLYENLFEGAKRNFKRQFPKATCNFERDYF